MENGELWIKASLEKKKIEQHQHKSIPNWRTQQKLDILNDILKTIQQPKTHTEIIQNQELDTQRSVLQRAKQLLSRTRKKHSNQIDKIYANIQQNVQDEDDYGKLVIKQINTSLVEQEVNLINQPHSYRSVKTKMEPIIRGYQLLPKITVGNKIKRKQETLKTLNQMHKIDTFQLKQDTIASLNKNKLPQLMMDADNTDIIEQILLREELHKKSQRNRLKKPPTMVESYQCYHQQLMNSATYQQQLYQLDKKRIRNSIDILSESMIKDYQKLAQLNNKELFY